MAYILLVDDDEDLAGETAEALRKEGYEVNIELDIDSGLKKVDERLPDLMILDVMFPGNDAGGFQLAQQLSKKFKKEKKFPILMVSAVNEYFLPGFGAKDIDDDWMPVTDFVEKPVDFGVLKQKVADLLAKGG